MVFKVVEKRFTQTRHLRIVKRQRILFVAGYFESVEYFKIYFWTFVKSRDVDEYFTAI